MLLVDADECFRSGVADNLRDDGHEVCEYATAGDVPFLAAASDIAIAVLDFSLPNAATLSLADAVHLAHPDAAVVLVRAYCGDDNETAVTARPFLQVQSRPLDYDVLHNLIHRLCDRRSLPPSE